MNFTKRTLFTGLFLIFSAVHASAEHEQGGGTDEWNFSDFYEPLSHSKAGELIDDYFPKFSGTYVRNIKLDNYRYRWKVYRVNFVTDFTVKEVELRIIFNCLFYVEESREQEIFFNFKSCYPKAVHHNSNFLLKERILYVEKAGHTYQISPKIFDSRNAERIVPAGDYAEKKFTNRIKVNDDY